MIAALGACSSGDSRGSGSEPAVELRATPPQVTPVKARSSDDFRALCEGRPLEAVGAPYAKQPGKASPAVFFLRDHGELGTVDWLSVTPWMATSPEQTQLVVCTTIEASTKLAECAYKDDHVLELRSARVKLSIIDAGSGKTLLERSFDHPGDPSCGGPFAFHTFKQQREIEYPDLDVAVARALDAFQPEDAPPPKTTALLGDACLGKRALGGAAYHPEHGATNYFTVLARDTTGAAFGSRFVVATEHDELESRYPRPPSLIVCLDGTRKGRPRSCAFEGRQTLSIHGGTWKVAAVDPRTGATIASTQIAADTSCPFVWDFGRNGSETLGEPRTKIDAFLKPLLRR